MRGRAIRQGFTIVELLIVIVVIAILAVVTVVAFNGVQDRARRTALSSEVVAIAKQLRQDQAINAAYPATLADANGGAGVKTNDGLTLRYSVNNATNPQTFCVTATDGKLSYMVGEAGVASEGGCVNVALGSTSPNTLLTDSITTSSPYHSGAVGLVSVTVTLPATHTISTVKVWHYYADARRYNATRTEVSADNVTWTTIFDSASSGTYVETAAGKTHTFSAQPVRYIRDWINGSTSNTGNHWVEIQAY